MVDIRSLPAELGKTVGEIRRSPPENWVRRGTHREESALNRALSREEKPLASAQPDDNEPTRLEKSSGKLIEIRRIAGGW